MTDLPTRDKLPTVKIVPAYDSWLFRSLFVASTCGAGFYGLARVFPSMLRPTPESAGDLSLQMFALGLGFSTCNSYYEHRSKIEGATLQRAADEVILRKLIEK